jgi:hypothetical protein
MKYNDLTTAELLELLTEADAKRLEADKVSALNKAIVESSTYELSKRITLSGEYEGYKVTVSTDDEVPFGANWAAIIQYVKDTGEVDLLEKRLLKSGVKARWADGKEIPGVTKTSKTTLKVSK